MMKEHIKQEILRKIEELNTDDYQDFNPNYGDPITTLNWDKVIEDIEKILNEELK